MRRSQQPIGDTDFLWQRYGTGIILPIALIAGSSYSMITRHSYAVFCDRTRLIYLSKLDGESAFLMGLAYLGIAIMLFANFYAQYHEKMGFYYQWILGPGAILTLAGIGGCSWILLWY